MQFNSIDSIKLYAFAMVMQCTDLLKMQCMIYWYADILIYWYADMLICWYAEMMCSALDNLLDIAEAKRKCGSGM